MLILGAISAAATGGGEESPTSVVVFRGLFNGSNGSNLFVDDTGRHPVGIFTNTSATTMPSNATAQHQEGTASLSFPATSSAQTSYIQVDTRGTHEDFYFEGDFDITFYFRTASSSGSILMSFGTFYIVLTYAGGGTLNLTNWAGLGHPNTLTCNNIYTTNAWHKCNLSRTNDILKLTLNDDEGNSDSMTVSGTFGNGKIQMGNNYTAANPLAQCFLDNVVITNYDVAETLPTLVLQLEMNGSNGGTVFTDTLGRHTITRVGGTTSSTTPYEGNASFLSGSGNNYIYTDSSSDFIWAGDFNITLWFKPTSTTNSGLILTFTDFVLKTASTSIVSLVISGTHGSTTISPSNTYTNNAWNKLILKREGTTTYLILNDDTGSQATINTVDMQTTIGDGTIYFGNQTAVIAGAAPINIDNIVITKG